MRLFSTLVQSGLRTSAALALCLIALPAHSATVPLFRVDVIAPFADVEPDPLASRRKAVLIDTSAFSVFLLDEGQRDSRIVPDGLQIDLFDGDRVFATLESAGKTSSGSVSWSGHLEGNSDDVVTLVVAGDVVQGNITRGEQQYQIRYLERAANGGAVHVLQQANFNAYPPEHPPEGSEGSSLLDQVNEQLRAQEAVQAQDANSTLADDGSVIDVLIVWTPSARIAAGGAVAVAALVDLAIVETNNGYADSGVGFTMNLAHAEEIAYTESGSFFTDLARLEGTADGFMDGVHALRDTHAADMVGLLNNTNQYCGLASGIGSSAATAFQVTWYNCATGYYSFAHEFGHLQSARHNWEADGTDNSPYPYNHGYFLPGSGWRTIMSYSNSACGGSCTRVPRWSNPDLSFSGSPTGNALTAFQPTHNALTLNNTALAVSNYRQTISAGPPGVPTLVSPNANGSAQETYIWNAVAATPATTWYYLWIQNENGVIYNRWHTAAAAGCAAGTGTCSIMPGVNLGGAVTWYIQAYNDHAGGSRSLWSAGMSYATGVSPNPGRITALLSPTGTGAGTLGPYVWESINDALWYQVWVQDAASNAAYVWYRASALGCAAGGNCSTAGLAQPNMTGIGSPAYWYIRAWNEDTSVMPGIGLYGPWSVGAEFTP